MNGDLPASTAIFEIKSDIEAIAKNAFLYEEKSFDKRIEARPCAIQVALQNWLDLTAPNDGNIYKPVIFTSL